MQQWPDSCLAAFDQGHSHVSFCRDLFWKIYCGKVIWFLGSSENWRNRIASENGFSRGWIQTSQMYNARLVDQIGKLNRRNTSDQKITMVQMFKDFKLFKEDKTSSRERFAKRLLKSKKTGGSRTLRYIIDLILSRSSTIRSVQTSSMEAELDKIRNISKHLDEFNEKIISSWEVHCFKESNVGHSFAVFHFEYPLVLHSHSFWHLRLQNVIASNDLFCRVFWWNTDFLPLKWIHLSRWRLIELNKWQLAFCVFGLHGCIYKCC